MFRGLRGHMVTVRGYQASCFFHVENTQAWGDPSHYRPFSFNWAALRMPCTIIEAHFRLPSERSLQYNTHA